MKEFLHLLKRSGVTHVVVNEDGEPTAAILPFERYQELLDGTSRRSHVSPNGRRTVSIPDPEPSPATHEEGGDEQGAGEPHFQFEPLPDDEDLT